MATIFFSVQPQPHLLRSAAGSSLFPRTTTVNGGRRRGFFRPAALPARRRPGHDNKPASSSAALLSTDFDFQEAVASVRAILHQHHHHDQRRRRGQKSSSSREWMATVDHLKRLCIDHYFQDEIDGTIKSSCMELVHSDDLLDATLAFRLMREAGYHVSADEVLGRFIDDDSNGGGDFRLCHSKDISGLLSLQDASHLNMGSEASLYKAKEFSSRHLRSTIDHLQLQDPNLARYVRHSLDHPYHVSLVQYKARHHLSYLQSLPTTCNTRNLNTVAIMEELALAEFHLNKLMHQTEIQEIKRWWVNLGLAQEIPTTREQVMKWYMWAMTALPGQLFSRYRIETTKLISFVYVVDDIFDVVATQEELFLFTEAVKRWDLAAGDSLPGYLKSCYNALYTVINDIADMAEKEHGMNPIDHLKKAWAMLLDGFMVEGKWLSTNQVPASEDYLRNGVVTSGVPLVLLHIFFMLGGHDHAGLKLSGMDPVICCPAKILRLWDDMSTAKDEAQEGAVDGSYKELYLDENPGCCWRDAEEHMVGMIASEWEELNRACFSSNVNGDSSSPASFVRASLNSARMVSVMYSYDHHQRLPVLEEYTRMLLF